MPPPREPRAAVPESWPQRSAHVGRGFVMGVADVIPGVSGGTIALILGIYTRLVDAIRSFDLEALRAAPGILHPSAQRRGQAWQSLRRLDLLFLIPLVAGIGLAVLTMASFFARLLETHPVPLLALFFGLILASVRIPWRMLEAPGVPEVTTALTGALIAFVITGLPTLAGTDGLWAIPLAGAIAICAMILPGVSGSYLLLVMGMWQRMVNAVDTLDVTRILLFVAGAGVGILAFSRVLSWLLHEKRNVTLAFLTGLMIGSLRRVWPFKEYYTGEFGEGANVLPDAFTVDVGVAAAAAGAGLALVALLDQLSRLKGQPDA